MKNTVLPIRNKRHIKCGQPRAKTLRFEVFKDNIALLGECEAFSQVLTDVLETKLNITNITPDVDDENSLTLVTDDNKTVFCYIEEVHDDYIEVSTIKIVL